MTQIRLAEAACKHSVALAFFRLALESECEVSISSLLCCFYQLTLLHR